MLESPFNKVAVHQASNFTEMRMQHRCFPVKFAEFLRIPTLKNICERLLLPWRSCRATKVWCWPKKMAGVEILVRVEQMILWTFIMILWSLTYDSSHFSFPHCIVMNFPLNLLCVTSIHIPFFSWKNIISQNQKIKWMCKILQYQKSYWIICWKSY